jgi:hypothetical protein
VRSTVAPPDAWLAALLCGEPPRRQPVPDPVRLVGAAIRHGVLPLLAEQAARARADWPPELQVPLMEAARAVSAAALVQERELEKILDALQAARISPLLFKGAALAYTHYGRPCLRPRADTDLLIDPADRATVHEVLRSSGYARPPIATGDFVSHQALYVKRDALGLVHALDIHWKIANPQVFADLLTFGELAAQATPLPALGPGVRGVAGVHALLLACLHRVAHHDDESGLLIWLYDIHLLAAGLSPGELQRFVRLAREKQARAVCAAGLRRARVRFDTAVPPFVLDELDRAAGSEETARFLRPRRRKVDILRSDFARLSWRGRLQLLREHLLPPAGYVRAMYAGSRLPLPLLYAHRIARGARRWF